MGYYDGYLEKKNSLYHSDTYLGADYSDGIKHWKYIRKYKGKNGKWRYVYFNKAKKFIDTRVTGNAYKEEAEIAKAQAQAYQDTVDYQTQRLADYNKEYADNYIAYKSIGDMQSVYKLNREGKDIKESQKKYMDAVAEENKKYNKLMETYKKKSLSGIAQTIINDGKDFVSRLFKKKR